MKKNTVYDLLRATTPIEIENQSRIKDNSIEIDLPDGSCVEITFEQVGKQYIYSEGSRRVNERVFKHDYGNIGELHANKLLLCNLQDVKDYVTDVVTANVKGVVMCGNTVTNLLGEPDVIVECRIVK